MTGSHQRTPSDHLEVEVDGYHIHARLMRFPSSGAEASTRQPRWMLHIDGQPTINGPLTWEGPLDPETERAAIVAFVRERRRIAAESAGVNRELAKRREEIGSVNALAEALGVEPEALAKWR
jgi:hypothetical protein